METLMTRNRTLTSQQIAEFDRRGVLRLEGLLSVAHARRAREYVQNRLALLGLWRDGEWRLGDQPRPQWPKTGEGLQGDREQASRCRGVARRAGASRRCRSVARG